MSEQAYPYESRYVGWDMNAGSYFDTETGILISEDDARELSRGQIIDMGGGAGGGTDGLHTITAEENQLALNQAAAQAAEQLGLTGFPKSEWSQDQRVHYIDAFRGIILANPDRFSDVSYQVASAINTNDLRNTSSTAEFGVWVTDNLQPVFDALRAPSSLFTGMVDAIDSLGRSVSNTAKFAPYIVPLAAVAFLYFAVQATGRDPGGQSGKVIRAFR